MLKLSVSVYITFFCIRVEGFSPMPFYSYKRQFTLLQLQLRISLLIYEHILQEGV